MAFGPLKLVRQRRRMDCGVACLATLLGWSYEDANDAFVHATGKTASGGYYQHDVTRAAATRGVTLVRVRRGEFDPEHTVGILGVGKTSSWDHLVILHNGTIYDAEDDALSTVKDYCRQHGLKAWSVLVRHDAKGGHPW